jgi:hypothetical protein
MESSVVGPKQAVFQPDQGVVATYQAVILERPSMPSTTASRSPMKLRVSFDDEEKLVEQQRVVLTREAMFSTAP